MDDDDGVRRFLSRLLTRNGWEVTDSNSAKGAIAELDAGEFDAIVADVSMPGMSGIELLRAVRSRDLELPVILVTGQPSLETAAEAVDHGAFKYLIKPVHSDALVAAVDHASKMRRLGVAKREAMKIVGVSSTAADRAGLEVQLDRALESLTIVYQPIISSRDGGVFAYEALMRSSEPALPHPGAVLEAAERLDRIIELGRVVRARAAQPMAEAVNGALLFVNLHPSELLDDRLADETTPLGRIASRVVLEITERASLESVGDVSARIGRLRAIGFRIAVDDLGAGYAGLSTFTQVEPEFVKLDMSLVRGVSDSETRQKVIGSLSALCRELKMVVVAEGVETDLERDALVTLECDLLQGFRFARPGPPFPRVSW